MTEIPIPQSETDTDGKRDVSKIILRVSAPSEGSASALASGILDSEETGGKATMEAIRGGREGILVLAKIRVEIQKQETTNFWRLSLNTSTRLGIDFSATLLSPICPTMLILFQSMVS
jgi:hypothetical protein